MAKQYDFSVPNDQITYGAARFRDDRTVLDSNGIEHQAADVLASFKLPEGTTAGGEDLSGYTVSRYAYMDYDTMEPFSRPDELNEGWSAFYFRGTEETVVARKLGEDGRPVASKTVEAAALAAAIDEAYGDHVRPVWINVPAEKATIEKGEISIELPDGPATMPRDEALYVARNEEKGTVGIKVASNASFQRRGGETMDPAGLRQALSPKKENMFLNLPAGFVKTVNRPKGAEGPDRYVVTMPKGMKAAGFDIGNFKVELNTEQARFYPSKSGKSVGILMEPNDELSLYKFNSETGGRDYLPKPLSFAQVVESREKNQAEFTANQSKTAPKRARDEEKKPETVPVKKAEAPAKAAQKKPAAKRD
jgi:hypothetical protein